MAGIIKEVATLIGRMLGRTVREEPIIVKEIVKESIPTAVHSTFVPKVLTAWQQHIIKGNIVLDNVNPTTVKKFLSETDDNIFF